MGGRIWMIFFCSKKHDEKYLFYNFFSLNLKKNKFENFSKKSKKKFFGIFSKNEIHMTQLHVTLFRTTTFFPNLKKKHYKFKSFKKMQKNIPNPSIHSRGKPRTKRAFLPHFHNAVTRQWTDGFRSFFV